MAELITLEGFNKAILFNLEHLKFTSYCKFTFDINVILKDLLYRCIIFESDLN